MNKKLFDGKTGMLLLDEYICEIAALYAISRKEV